jgi:3-hydroxyisobutyrate dehydrogenase-like beta-hydroxyacid dehydrogenase
MESRIGMAGLGIMGRGMARNLLRKGFAVSVWNRSPEPAAEFSDRATVAGSPQELAATCSVVIGCVSDPPAVERVVFAEDGVLAYPPRVQHRSWRKIRARSRAWRRPSSRDPRTIRRRRR